MPGAAGSKTSPTSVCIINTISPAILPMIPATAPNASPISAIRSRVVNHGTDGA
ncbi:hypothetical protein [Breoghania sp.]|uniref:hypothetical protein n=1 Tax=Breoghania sp. TaxID=2065378 RepID=UPI0026214F70|nr:hypothetical protein [Breoghania sp.]MDJ0932003.1 hypothetical protein [Breoghania sp.]